MGTGSCGDLFGRTAPLLGQATDSTRRAETRRLRNKIIGKQKLQKKIKT
jgi:hypothetical protein